MNPLVHSRMLTGQANGLLRVYPYAAPSAASIEGMLTMARLVNGKSQGSRSGLFTCCWPRKTSTGNATASGTTKITHDFGKRMADEPTLPSDEAAW